MRNPIALGAAALVAFAAATIAVIRLAEAPAVPVAIPVAAPAASAPVPVAGVQAATVDPVAVNAPPAADSPAGPALPAATTADPGTPAAPRTWESVPVASRAAELGRVAGPVNAALQRARDAMDPCFADEASRLERATPPAIDPNDPPRGPAVVVLQLEGAPGELEIVDATLDYLGTSTRELVTCCSQHLVGVRIAAPAATAGQRFRMKYLLQ